MPRFDPTRARMPDGLRADIAVAVGVLLLVGFAEGSRWGRHGQDTPALVGSWLLAMAVCAALLFQRRHPVAVGWCTVVGTGAYYLLSTVDGPLALVPIVVLYALSSQGRIQAAIAMAATMIIGVGSSPLIGNGDVTGTTVFMLTGWLVAVLALGGLRHGRVTYAEEVARLRATQERLRIARELHDVIGHTMSMINVQAAAALHGLKKNPDQAEEALSAIKAGSRDGLRELRATLGVLRQVDEAAPTKPAPGLAQTNDLVASAGLAGLAVQIEKKGTERPLPAAVDLAAYRIVQESLTNAAKHGQAKRVVIRLCYEDEHLMLDVEDDGRGTSSAPEDHPGGSGIAGMTERARALGGTLTTEQRPQGGFAVRARLPFEDPGHPQKRSHR